jgi:hypothetical protein
MEEREKIVKELIRLIEKSHAHVTFEDALKGLPAKLRTIIPDKLPYSIWQLVEHIRIAQADIVDFSTTAEHEVLDWPADYWIDSVTEVSDSAWEASLAAIYADRERFFALLRNPDNDLFKPFEWGTGQTLFKEATLIADHNAYHVAEIVVIRRLLGDWH